MIVSKSIYSSLCYGSKNAIRIMAYGVGEKRKGLRLRLMSTSYGQTDTGFIDFEDVNIK